MITTAQIQHDDVDKFHNLPGMAPAVRHHRPRVRPSRYALPLWPVTHTYLCTSLMIVDRTIAGVRVATPVILDGASFCSSSGSTTRHDRVTIQSVQSRHT